MKKFKKLLEIAIAMRPEKQNHECFHVAFVMKRNAILSIGWNDVRKGSAVQLLHPYKKECRLHAECSALQRLKHFKFRDRDASKLALIVLRVNNQGELRNSKPCAGCDSLIRENNFGKVWYSDNDQTFHELVI